LPGGKARFIAGTLAVLAVLASFAPGILGFPGGVGDGNKDPSTCASCHGTAGSGTVTVTAPSGEIHPGDAVDVTVTVTEQSLTGEGIAGVFLLKGNPGSQEPITVDGWTIVTDPNGNTNNYAEKAGISTGVATKFTWSLKAPAATGDYVIHADVEHGGAGPVMETSAPLTITVTPAGAGGSAPPVISQPELPASIQVGSTLNISTHITDDKEGVQSAAVFVRAPGATGFTQTPLALASGTAMDGTWSSVIDAGPAPGALELYITASDGTQESRFPADGSLTVTVSAPGLPAIEPPVLPAAVETGSMLNISARMTDSDNGVALAVLRYRLPGASDFATASLTLSQGTANDGTWTASINAGPAAGTLELWLEATDGTNDARSPASGTFAVAVTSPPGPAVEAFPPDSVTYGTVPEVRARITDISGASGVRVHYRHGSETADRTADMARVSGDERDGQWSALLPAANATGNWSFFVSARNARSEGRSAEVSFKVLPDLYVSGLKVSTKQLLVKKKVVLSAVIGNRGDRAVTGLSVNFLDQSYSVGDFRHLRVFTNLTVPANGLLELRASWTPMVDGKRTLAVVLNPDGKVEEGNLTNDRMTATVAVSLESGMGIRFPIPKPADLQVQLIVICLGAAILGTRIFLWQRAANRKAESDRKERMRRRAAEAGGRED
jgi:hypothetical protein